MMEERRNKTKSVAIVLAAGSGSRMNSGVAKQYLLIKEKPLIWYSLSEFERCPFIDEIVLVTRAEDISFCRTEIVEKYGFEKVRQIVEGGQERYDSVYLGLLAAGVCDYVYIHDGARPFVSREILERLRDDVGVYGACTVGMPVKDTIKLSDEDGFCASTPDRSRVWQIQTPQAFSRDLILSAHERLRRLRGAGDCARGTSQTGGQTQEETHESRQLQVTDDAMVVEQMTDVKVKLTRGDYRNIKITTPEDLRLAELFAEERGNCS